MKPQPSVLQAWMGSEALNGRNARRATIREPPAKCEGSPAAGWALLCNPHHFVWTFVRQQPQQHSRPLVQGTQWKSNNIRFRGKESTLTMMLTAVICTICYQQNRNDPQLSQSANWDVNVIVLTIPCPSSTSTVFFWVSWETKMRPCGKVTSMPL